MIEWIADRWDSLKIAATAAGVVLTLISVAQAANKYFSGLDACWELGTQRAEAFKKMVVELPVETISSGIWPSSFASTAGIGRNCRDTWLRRLKARWN